MPLGRDALVGDLEHCFYDFPETVGNFIIPTFPKSMIFQRGWLKPPVLDTVEMSGDTEHVNFRM
jgi:hypothetical protein